MKIIKQQERTYPLGNYEGSEVKLLSALKDLNVPFQKSVALLCSVKNISFQRICDSAGYNRNSLYKALKEQRRPKFELYRSVVSHLGVDPWAVYEVKSRERD
jgi:DNA-binding phage protein